MHSQTTGTTFEQFKPEDWTHLFRKQNKRGLAEVDTLLLRQEQIKGMIGAAKADEIEKQPDLYYNHEKFRQWQAKARFRATLTTLIAAPAVFTVLNGGRNGVGYAKRNPMISLPATIGIFVSSFYMWHRVVGYNKNVALEQAFAKNHKMLRNLIIQQ